MKKSLFFILSLLLVLFFSCGASSSEESSSSEEASKNTVTVTGSVVDGEIEGATVKLVKIEDDSELTGTATTDENGTFSIEVELPEGESIEEYMVKAEDGVDVSSGEEQDGVVMTRPIEGETDQTVTPVTSLLTEEVKETLAGKKPKEVLAAAKTKIKTMLGLASDADVTKNPLEDDKILRNAALLNKIAKKVKKSERAKAFEQLKKVLAKVKNQLGGKDFADAIGADTAGNGIAKAFTDDTDLKLADDAGTGDANNAQRGKLLTEFRDGAKEDKETAGLKDALPGSDEKAKLKKLALLRGINKVILKAFVARDKTQGSFSSDKASHAKGVLRIATYIAGMVAKVNKKSNAKLAGDVTKGLLKGITFSDLKKLGGLDLSSADTAQKKVTAVSGLSGGVAAKITAMIDAIKADAEFKKEPAAQASDKATIFTLVSGYLQ